MHMLHAITRPAELRYNDLLATISSLSQSLTENALDSSHAEQRDMHTDITTLVRWKPHIDTKIDQLMTHILKHFCVSSIELLRDSKLPVIWALKTLTSDKTTADQVSTIDILKYLIQQAVKVNENIHTDAALAPRFGAHLRAKTEEDWVKVLASDLQGIPLVYIVLDVEGPFTDEYRDLVVTVSDRKQIGRSTARTAFRNQATSTPAEGGSVNLEAIADSQQTRGRVNRPSHRRRRLQIPTEAWLKATVAPLAAEEGPKAYSGYNYGGDGQYLPGVPDLQMQHRHIALNRVAVRRRGVFGSKPRESSNGRNTVGASRHRVLSSHGNYEWLAEGRKQPDPDLPTPASVHLELRETVAMAIINLLVSPLTLATALVAVVAYYVYPYFVTYSQIRDIPAPFPAQFTNWWLLYACRRGKRYLVVDEVHKKLGTLVRIQPHHVSIADDEAIQIIYGHGNGFLKSEFYDAFVSIKRGLFNTRDRTEHTRKRKLVSHTFAPRSISQFEPYIAENLETFVNRWDELAEKSPRGDKTAHVDCLKWFNYVAFDTIGDLAFGAPFGMLKAGADIAEVRTSLDAPPIYAPAVEILNRRGEVSAALGCLPSIKPYAKWLPDPFFSKGLTAVENLAGIAIARVKERLDNPPDINRKDLLARLQEGRDEKGEPLGFQELTAEALTQLIAGSDTTSNSSCALLYHAARTPGVLKKLQGELDAAIPGDSTKVPDYESVRNLPYLEAVINETLRIHSTSGIGLPRQIPEDSPGISLHGHYFPPGTVLSVPTYTIHHSKEIWGADADEFRPERWAEATPRQRNAFIPFSYGPRSCVGRNVAEMEMKMIAATWLRRYDVFLRQEVMETREGFLRKPLGLEIGFKRRV
ncbi:hypothetical protein CHU98_g3423 [Xylaria longipes]|nr:hypothetical protein CHU98_g3423 [Xylaria longipes]